MKLIITKLKKQIGELEISINSLKLEQGKIHGLFGGNGCGKSTLSKMILGAITPDSGVINYSPIKPDEVTLMPQRPYMLQRSVYENIIYPLQIRNMDVDENAIDALLERTNLQHKKNQYARTLSSGERQKISFIRSLIFNPKLVIVDETLSNLDIDSLKIFLDLILDWQKEHHITWLIISHQLSQMETLCDQVHYMKKGNIVASGTLSAIMSSIDALEI